MPDIKANLVPNVLNRDSIEIYIVNLCSDLDKENDRHIVTWFRTTWLKSELRNMESLRPCRAIPARKSFLVFSSIEAPPETALASRELPDNAYMIDNPEELPGWASGALLDDNLYYWNPILSAGNAHKVLRFAEYAKHRHWIDYFLLLKKSDLFIGVAQLESLVQAWDEEREKRLLAMEGYTLTGDSVGIEGTDYYLVKLTLPKSYLAEAALMSHCVDAYVGKEGTQIFSLRKNGYTGRPFATIEVQLHRLPDGTFRQSIKDGRVVQAKGFANGELATEAKDAIRKWAAKTECNISIYAM
jgi:hypothetical protein